MNPLEIMVAKFEALHVQDIVSLIAVSGFVTGAWSFLEYLALARALEVLV